MKRESVAFLISGVVFGLLIGWMIGSQQGVPSTSASTAAAPVAPPGQPQGVPPPPPLDTQQAAALEMKAKAAPADAAVRVELANLYFNAERYELAMPWYEEALKLNPKDVNASTDLGVSYYYMQQDDKALSQFAHSLSIDPKHVKTLFNQGIVLAFGKHDLDGASVAWQKVIAVAPDSEEGKRSKQILDGLKSGHAGTGAQPADPGRGLD